MSSRSAEPKKVANKDVAALFSADWAEGVRLR